MVNRAVGQCGWEQLWERVALTGGWKREHGGSGVEGGGRARRGGGKYGLEEGASTGGGRGPTTGGWVGGGIELRN